MLKNKKGGIDLTLAEIAFILANVLIFIALFVFVVRAGSGAGIYEQQYSKKIALLIDQAKPNTEIELDISDVVKKFEKEKKILEVFKVNEEENKVIVKLREGRGYDFEYFSDVDVELESKKDEENYYLVIKIGGK